MSPSPPPSADATSSVASAILRALELDAQTNAEPLARQLVDLVGPVRAEELAHDPSELREVLQKINACKTPQDTVRLLEQVRGEPLLPAQLPGLLVFGQGHYHALREAISKNTFTRCEGSPWPTAMLKEGAAHGEVQLRPAAVDAQPLLDPADVEAWTQLMWSQRGELSDLDADALDALSALWIQQATSPEQDATTSIDALLVMRGIKPKQNGAGRRGGFDPAQRKEVLKTLAHIQNLWLNMAEIEAVGESTARGSRRKRKVQTLQSRAFVITDRVGQLRLDGHMDIQAFVFRPGKVFAHFLFGPGRQTALLSAKALHYDPYRQVAEKRLTRYLSYHWRQEIDSLSAARPHQVQTLLDVAGIPLNARYAQRTRERLEKALDRLQSDDVISNWQYTTWNEPLIDQRGWSDKWLTTMLHIEPPASVRRHYLARPAEPCCTAFPLACPEPEGTLETPARPGIPSLGERIRERRQQLTLTQSVAASSLGLTQAYLSKVEAGKLTPSPENLERLETWLQETRKARNPRAYASQAGQL